MDCPSNLTNLLIDWEHRLEVYSMRCHDFLSAYEKHRSLYLLDEIVTGKGFKPLDYFYIGEREHSQILADLLSPTGTHGYKTLFLNEFLTHLEIPNLSENDHWEIWAEAGRVDVLLKRRHPFSVIIIENKSNNARDQDNQLYRYWFQEIYWPLRHNRDYDYKARDTYLVPEIRQRYRVIYLATNEAKVPSNLSLAKPDWKELDPGLPDTMPIEYEVRIYGEFIKTWLGACLPQISDPNHRLRGFIQTYIDYWTN